MIRDASDARSLEVLDGIFPGAVASRTLTGAAALRALAFALRAIVYFSFAATPPAFQPRAFQFFFQIKRLRQFELWERFIAAWPFDSFAKTRRVRCIRVFGNVVPARDAHENVAVGCVGPGVDRERPR